jgi:hypothetical protein
MGDERTIVYSETERIGLEVVVAYFKTMTQTNL